MKISNEVKEKFKRSIKLGTGEAYLLMKANAQTDLSNEIIKAALKNLSYDNQSEGSRAGYVFELIQLSKQKEKIRKRIIKALYTERKDDWGLEQTFDLAALFAKQGDKEARKAVYENFAKDVIEHCEWIGEDALIEMDGLEGLKQILSNKGEQLENDPDTWLQGWRIEDFQKKNPGIKVYSQLVIAAKKNPHLKRYLNALREEKNRSEKRPKLKINYQTVTEKIEHGAIVPLTHLSAGRLKGKDIKKLADDFLKQTEVKKIERYLRVFDKVKFPYDHSVLLGLAKGRNKKGARVAEFACGALKFFADKRIRKLALEKIKNTRVPYFYLDLLVSNYKKGDAKMLTAAINRCRNDDEFHSMVFGIITIYENNPTKECKGPLEALYYNMNCGLHREDLVRIMIKNKVLSARIKKEIAFDSLEGTRKLLAPACRRQG